MKERDKMIGRGKRYGKIRVRNKRPRKQGKQWKCVCERGRVEYLGVVRKERRRESEGEKEGRIGVVECVGGGLKEGGAVREMKEEE